MAGEGNTEEDAIISILNYNPDGDAGDNKIITSPRSLQACQITGI